MKKTILALATACALALSLTGCITVQTPAADPKPAVTTQAPEPEATPTEAPPAEEPQTGAPDEQGFRDFINVKYPGMGDADSTLPGGYGVCKVFDSVGVEQGLTILIGQAGDDQAAQEAVAYLTVGAVTYLCPEYYDEVKAWAEAGSDS